MKVPIYRIGSPRWKDLTVGIAVRRLTDPCLIAIDYTDRFGNKPFANVYQVPVGRAETMEEMVVKGVRLKMFPIEDLRIVGPDTGSAFFDL